MPKLYALTEDQVKRLDRAVRAIETLIPGQLNSPLSDGPPLWSYIAKATEEISAIDGDDLGKGSVKMQKINTGDDSIDDTALDDVDVYNLSNYPIPDHTYVGMIRDPYSGKYVIPPANPLVASFCYATSSEAVETTDETFTVSSAYIVQPATGAEWPGGSAPTTFYNRFDGELDNAVLCGALYNVTDETWDCVIAPCPV